MRWAAHAEAERRGRLVLIHGMSSLGESWWRMGPELARRGWDVTAVQQLGHGGAAAPGQVDAEALADAVLAQHPEPADVLIGHSLGTITALALLDRHPGWAGTVILEEPPKGLVAGSHELALALTESLHQRAAQVRIDRAAVEQFVRLDCPRWADDDVFWAVEGIARMDVAAYATWLESGVELDVVEQALHTTPAPWVLAAISPKTFLEGGSALPDSERRRLAAELPPGHVIEIAGGHCLHRDAPAAWLAALARILSEEATTRDS